jgi:hypothetical protein
VDWGIHFVASFLNAFQQLWINPFYYAGLLFVIVHYMAQIRMERKLFHTKLHSLVMESWITILWGWLSGLIVSFLFLFIHIEFQTEWVLLIWAFSLGFMLIRRSFSCIAYSVGAIGVLQLIILGYEYTSPVTWINDIVIVIADVNLYSLLVVVGVLHVVEGILLTRKGSRISGPVYTEGKRGHRIGGYQTEAFWVVPLFIVVPLHASQSMDSIWTSLFSLDFHTQFGFIAFPAMIGFSHFALSKTPQQKVKQDGTAIFLFGCMILLMAIISISIPWVGYLGAFLSIFLHEFLMKVSLYIEKRNSPLFAHSAKGLRVLSVIPHSPAEKLGIQMGEIIHRINGVKIQNRDDLYLAMQHNSAFCKLEIINLDHEIKFVNTPLYEDEHYELGLILSPDPHAKDVVPLRFTRLWDYFRY